MIKIFNLIIEDKHCDVEVQSFTTRDAAIEAAKDFLDSVQGEGNWEAERPPRGWEFLAYYGESTVSVRPGELHGVNTVVDTEETEVTVYVGPRS